MMVASEQLWETFSIPLQQFIQRRVPDPHSAEDILQDVFLKIHTHIDTLHSRDRVAAWIYQIARNAIADYYRLRQQTSDVPETLAAASGSASRSQGRSRASSGRARRSRSSCWSAAIFSSTTPAGSSTTSRAVPAAPAATVTPLYPDYANAARSSHPAVLCCSLCDRHGAVPPASGR